MRRVAVIAVVVSALVGAVGAEAMIKARSNALPKATITVEEIESVTVEASALNVNNEIVTADTQPMNGNTYASN
jgi:hypothetical protein